MFVSFGDIPGHYNLFLDYLHEFENVKDFYPYSFKEKEEYRKVFKSISDSERPSRLTIKSIIEKQYHGFDLPPKLQNNISALSSPKTLAVCTGQQLGLLGGPLYTFYKIITAIKLSKNLSERHDDYQFIPVFWLEGEDHDFNEIRSINLLNDMNELTTVNYGEEIPDDDIKVSVGTLKLNQSINQVFGQLESVLRETEFKASIISQLKSFYREGETIKQAFKNLLHSIFAEYGLIIFDPQDKDIKNLLRPVFLNEIQNFRTNTEKLVNVSAKLEELYHAQVKIRPINFFYSTDEGRYAIEPYENEFRLKRKRKSFTYDELIAQIENEPERFSPNVLLRPICQDYLFPTAFYVGGPSEVAYFAQVNVLYKSFNIVPPIVYPRASATIVEKSILSSLEKFNLQITDVFRDPEVLKNKIIQSVSETSVDDAFLDLTNQIDLSFDRLKEKLFDIDKTMSDLSNKYREKIFSYIEELKSKAIQAEKKKHETTLRQIDKVSNSLYPNQALQEREMNFIYFVNKYGMDFLKKIYDELEINKFEHQIINI
ncbi:MAG: bacillithiol biosynthesis cysteine-adding enzyme BshC [Ignavibacteriaceae bacterium]|nr:bacillithiol biosynthesis cysteine-adding enzyme BshC [Ignavibacteriaceae bacterium]